MAISRAFIGVTEVHLLTDDVHLRGKFPPEYDIDGCPMAHYGEENGSVVRLFEAFYHISAILKFLKEHPRPAHREVYPRVEVFDDNAYWGEKGNKERPLKVLKDITLLELLEALKEFAPEYAR
jgi:hypothetical protein